MTDLNYSNILKVSTLPAIGVFRSGIVTCALFELFIILCLHYFCTHSIFSVDFANKIDYLILRNSFSFSLHSQLLGFILNPIPFEFQEQKH